MMNKIRKLSDKTMIFIGITLVLIAIVFFIVVSLAYGMAFNRWIDFFTIFYLVVA